MRRVLMHSLPDLPTIKQSPLLPSIVRARPAVSWGAPYDPLAQTVIAAPALEGWGGSRDLGNGVETSDGASSDWHATALDPLSSTNEARQARVLLEAHVEAGEAGWLAALCFLPGPRGSESPSRPVPERRATCSSVPKACATCTSAF